MDYQSQPLLVAPLPDGVRVTVVGPIHTNVAWLEGEFKKIVAHKPKRVELDLSQMPFVSSMGLGSLVTFRNEVLKAGGEIKTTAIQKPVLNIMRFAHLQELLKIDSATTIVPAT